MSAVFEIENTEPIPGWFCLHDGGRSESKRPRQSNDCTIRALALLYDRPYDEVYDRFARMGRKAAQGVANDQLKALLRLEGWTWQGYGSKAGEPRMHPDMFVEENPHGRFLLSEAHHVVAVIDGVYYDTSLPHATRCVYGVWSMPEGLVGEPIRS